MTTIEIDPAFKVDRHVAMRGDLQIPAPMRLEVLGPDQMRRKRVRNIHVASPVGGIAIDCRDDHTGGDLIIERRLSALQRGTLP